MIEIHTFPAMIDRRQLWIHRPPRLWRRRAAAYAYAIVARWAALAHRIVPSTWHVAESNVLIHGISIKWAIYKIDLPWLASVARAGCVCWSAKRLEPAPSPRAGRAPRHPQRLASLWAWLLAQAKKNTHTHTHTCDWAVQQLFAGNLPFHHRRLWTILDLVRSDDAWAVEI